jgi:hypothetical protein
MAKETRTGLSPGPQLRHISACYQPIPRPDRHAQATFCTLSARPSRRSACRFRARTVWFAQVVDRIGASSYDRSWGVLSPRAASRLGSWWRKWTGAWYLEAVENTAHIYDLICDAGHRLRIRGLHAHPEARARRCHLLAGVKYRCGQSCGRVPNTGGSGSFDSDITLGFIAWHSVLGRVSVRLPN